MLIKEVNLPFTLRASVFFIGIVAFTFILYIAQSIIIPIVFAVIIAILLHPVVNFFVKHKLNRVISIIITLLLTFIVIAAFGGFLISQVSLFAESWPILVDKFTLLLNQAIKWASGYFDINPVKFDEWITKTKSEFINNSSAAIGQTIVVVGNWLVVLFLIPTYTFIILFYQPLLREFISRLFAKSNKGQVTEIVIQIKTVIQRYLFGLIIETTIIATLEISALFILGIEYAILLGIIGALLNLIPYIGGLVAVALPMMIALATKTSAWYAIYVLIIYYSIQLLDNNYIVPVIVSSKVKINALFSIIVVIAGNALWGIPGMFLSIPLLAIVKLIFDHIDHLKPWGYLLGDTMPEILSIKPILKKLKSI